MGFLKTWVYTHGNQQEFNIPSAWFAQVKGIGPLLDFGLVVSSYVTLSDNNYF